MAECAVQNSRPVGQAVRAEDRDGRQQGGTARGPAERQGLRTHVRSSPFGGRIRHLPRRQTPESLFFNLYRGARRLYHDAGTVPQQTGRSLFQPHTSVPQNRREKHLQTGDAGTRHLTAGISACLSIQTIRHHETENFTALRPAIAHTRRFRGKRRRGGGHPAHRRHVYPERKRGNLPRLRHQPAGCRVYVPGRQGVQGRRPVRVHARRPVYDKGRADFRRQQHLALRRGILHPGQPDIPG